ncbi:MAG: hypothetical protein CMJ83_08695 [Planctomycetes bacterium]|nr:hypothetical protein [Planctomycetota bacterium]
MIRISAPFLLALALALPFAAGQDAPTPSLKVMTFNIRYANRRDGWDHWTWRKNLVAGTIRFHDADVCGTQEVLGSQLIHLHEQLPGYASVATGRDGRNRGERCAIFYKTARLERVKWATFWLSPTPDRPSAAWGARLRRIVTWAHFRDRRSRKEFFVFNTHFDHQSAPARLESARLLVPKVAELAGDLPVVVMGDLNCTPGSAPHRVLMESLQDAQAMSETGHYGPSGTFPGFGGAARSGRKIDHIFTKNQVRVLRHGILTPTVDERVASDHWPVLAEVVLGEQPRRETIELHDGWRMQFDPKREGQLQKYANPEFDDSRWRVIRAGQPWETNGTAPDGTAWFRTTATLPPAWKGRKLHFIAYGIDDFFTLYVNGHRVATIGARTTTVRDQRIALHLPCSLFHFDRPNHVVLEVTDNGGFGGLAGRPIGLSVSSHSTTHSAAQFRESTLIARTGFHINDDAKRALPFPIEIPGKPTDRAWLRYAVGDGHDDSGDRGLTVRLLDAAGKTIHEAHHGGKDDLWHEIDVRGGDRLTLVVEDQDTRLGGPSSGNDGTILVKLKRAPLSK